MSIVDLKEVLPPPAALSELGRPDQWNDVEQQLGTRLPDDYKDYINSYGTGMISSYLVVYNAFSAFPTVNLLQQSMAVLGAYEEMRRYRKVPFKLFPEHNGLLPCGSTADGDNIFWLTDTDPGDWTIVLDEMRGVGFEHHECDLTTLLSHVLRKELKSKILLYRNFKKKTFEPLRR